MGRGCGYRMSIKRLVEAGYKIRYRKLAKLKGNKTRGDI